MRRWGEEKLGHHWGTTRWGTPEGAKAANAAAAAAVACVARSRGCWLSYGEEKKWNVREGACPVRRRAELQAQRDVPCRMGGDD
jgi:hypothetical protein